MYLSFLNDFISLSEKEITMAQLFTVSVHLVPIPVELVTLGSFFSLSVIRSFETASTKIIINIMSTIILDDLLCYFNQQSLQV